MRYLILSLLAMVGIYFYLPDAQIALHKPDALSAITPNSTILAVGDSVTYGVGASSRATSYPGVLDKLIPAQVINAGISGERSASTLARIKNLLQMHEPQLVILCIGGNDFRDRRDVKKIKDNIQQIIQHIKAHGSEVVLISTIHQSFFLSYHPLFLQLALEEEIWLEQSAFRDYFVDNQLKSDVLHPNDKGYMLIAQRVFELLEKAGAL